MKVLEGFYKNINECPAEDWDNYPCRVTLAITKADFERLEVLRAKGKSRAKFCREAIHIGLNQVFSTPLPEQS